MLYRKSIWDLREGRISKDRSYLIVVMRYYPRGISKTLIDEYVRDLAPGESLFTEFKSLARKLGTHNGAFEKVRYEERFELTAQGMRRLEEVVQLSREREVVLLCQCRDFDRCHCDLLLILAQQRFTAEVQGLLFDYPVFRARFPRSP